jgi:cytidine deaminase
MLLTADDLALIETAKAAIRDRYREGWHVIGAALRTRSGRVFTDVHLEANVGRVAVCAEAVALGRAATEAGDTEIETIVAVYHPSLERSDRDIAIVAPCGACREMISDYSPGARVIVPGSDGRGIAVSAGELLPYKYRRPPLKRAD